MKLVHTAAEVRNAVKEARNSGLMIGFVPTMGALHEGHLTLARTAKRRCGFVVVSIFVNPTQFGINEDLSKYPRTLDSDREKCAAEEVDLIFAPAVDEMYPDGFDTWVDVGGITCALEGECRPGHFRGVTTVCAKLFNIVQPDSVIFGKKDYQQLAVINKMVRDLDMPIDIIAVETVREEDGLAMSSRNAYLSSDERKRALILSRSLKEAENAFRGGERSASAIGLLVESVIGSQSDTQIEYVAVVDAESLLPIDTIDKPAVVLLAVKIGSTRLIDNIVLEK